MGGLIIGLVVTCLAKDRLVLLIISIEVVTALVIGYSCILGPRSILIVGGMLVCGRRIMLAGLIMSI